MIQASVQRQGVLGIEALCAAVGVSRAGYYRHWQASAPREEETAVRDAVQRLSLADRRMGYRRIVALLRREGFAVNHKRVERLRRTDNLLCLRKAAFRPATTDSSHGFPVYPNLARSLVPQGPDLLWVADITYVRLAEEFVYLAVVLDAFSRRVIGWAIEDHLRAELALSALNMALAQRHPVAHLTVHHSDRGVQYASKAYIARLTEAKIVPSMSRIGCPWDNAMAESFMATLKREEANVRSYRDRQDAEASIGRFLEDVYNRHRMHSALGYLAPAEFEAIG